MSAEMTTKNKWFWPWEDEKQEAWLGEMSLNGWHLRAVHLLCSYSFEKGRPTSYVYRLDYYQGKASALTEYLQIFQDAGWEYLGELSNWRYWRKPAAKGESAEIFTDRQSKIEKYRRLLGVLAFFLILLVFMGFNLLRTGVRTSADAPAWIIAIYIVGLVAYALLIPLYILSVSKILARIKQLQKSP